MFTSQYGVKPPDRARRFMNGTAMLMAGSLAFNVYDINARTRDMDMEMISKMRARMFPVRLFVLANSMFLVGGLYSTSTQLKTVLDNEVEKVSVSD